MQPILEKKASEKMRTLSLFPLILCAGCIAGQMNSDVSKEISLAVPAQFATVNVPLPVAVNIPLSTTVDLSSDIKQYENIGNLSITINNNDLKLAAGSFDFLGSVQVSLSSGTLPPITIINHTLTSSERARKNLFLTPSNSPDLVNYFGLGPATITVLISATAGSVVPASITDDVSFHFSVQIDKTVL
jgi:hypothetical protein